MAAPGGGGASFWIADGIRRTYAVTSDSDLNVYLGGGHSLGQGAFDAWMVKYDGDGNKQWAKSLGGVEVDENNAVVVDSSGNPYGLGVLSDGSSSTRSAIKYDGSSGSITFKKIYRGGSGTRWGEAGAIDSNDNIYVASDTSINKINTSGTVQYTKSATNFDNTFAMTCDSSDNLLVLNNFSGLDILKLNSSGARQWYKSLISGAASDDNARGIAVDTNDDVYACGWNDDGAQIVKLNSSGTLQWQRRYGGSGDRFYSIATDSQNNVYASGYAVIPNQLYAAQIVKWNSSGTLQWQRYLSTGSNTVDIGYAMHVDAEDGLVVGVDNGGPGTVARLPTDGTGTGTYSGNLSKTRYYGTPSLSVTTTSYSLSNRNNSVSNESTTAVNVTLTEGTPYVPGSGPEPIV